MLSQFTGQLNQPKRGNFLCSPIESTRDEIESSNHGTSATFFAGTQSVIRLAVVIRIAPLLSLETKRSIYRTGSIRFVSIDICYAEPNNSSKTANHLLVTQCSCRARSCFASGVCY